MRYPPGMLPEILDAYERDGNFFASIRLIRDSEDRVFELGITRSAYAALRRVFQVRPFGQIPGATRRYFFALAVSKREDPERCIGTVRIEQDRDGKQFEFEMPSGLIANMLWFFEMKTLAPAQHLRSWAPNPA
jgi:hypothetical protein